MAIVPLGFMRSETNEHMKEGKRKGYGPNMAGPVTYAWFYDYPKPDDIRLVSVKLIAYPFH